ncbi:HD-GYP domain-containing protein [Streptomyces sp. LHD-70]|uniref:HD-GYP domain-containing protein n=1 Tax=Streptomyces sp. LHD-70 TaxID=3072140 RepID=UPI00280DE8B3|nr:HD-GYP domain-containing protein [Streptomyces sp. LHD-70]MDQ8702207.1 HD-GYP domain-containing protein [Streptomyces sp. LHD-70]
MRSVPPWAVVYIGLTAIGAALCAAPALDPSARTPWSAVALLAVLYAGCEQITRLRRIGPRAPRGMVGFFPVLLAGVFLVPPAAAALVAVPGAALARVELGPVSPIFAGPRRLARSPSLRPGGPPLAARPNRPSTSSTRAIRAHAESTLPQALGSARAGGTPMTPRPDPRRSGRRALGPAPPRRIWRPARYALACWAAATVHVALGGRELLTAGRPAAPDFPLALAPAAAAALVFALVVAALDGGILATAERVPVRAAWRGLFPRSLAPVLVHGFAGLMMAVLWRSPYGPPAALLVLLPMYISWWVFAQYHRERSAHQATIRALVQAVDIKDEYTRGHSERVGEASVLIARELGMADERVEVLRFAGILHDVGKLGVPTRLLRKDGPLTPEERRVIELHPEYGHEMVRGIGFLGEARSAILHHHERLDGSGYPYGLTGRQIPEFARVVAVADAFDAMTSTRSYRRGRPVADALTELKRCAGRQFDPQMVRALVRALDRHGWRPAVTSDEPEPQRTTAAVAAAHVPGPRGSRAPLAGDRPR